MRERICLFSPPTGLDAYSQNALELPHRVMPLLSPGISSWTRPACALRFSWTNVSAPDAPKNGALCQSFTHISGRSDSMGVTAARRRVIRNHFDKIRRLPSYKADRFDRNLVVELRTFCDLSPAAVVSFCLLRVKSHETTITV
jgi:hypothetical protein